MKNSDGLDHKVPLLSLIAPEGDVLWPSGCLFILFAVKSKFLMVTLVLFQGLKIEVKTV